MLLLLGLVSCDQGQYKEALAIDNEAKAAKGR
jgi:hypothetical protein